MGYARKRTGRDGKSRYTAYYLDIRGQDRSAGTFSNKKDATDAWKKAEATSAPANRATQGGASRHSRLRPGEMAATSPARTWRPQQLRRPDHQAPDPVLRAYEDARHHARARPPVGHPHASEGASARTIQYAKGSILNAIFTTALDDEVVTIHPSRGVKIPPVPDKPRRIITAGQFSLLYQALPDADARLLVETAIESGMRWGELTEVRVQDLDFTTCILTVSRAVIELSPGRPPRRRAIPRQGLPERQGVPALQAQPADHRQNPGPRHRQ